MKAKREGPELIPTTLALLVVLTELLAISPLWSQAAISANGVVESTLGGFRFPDGTVQSTASTRSLAAVEDSGQEGCWDTSGTETSCTGTGQDGELQSGVDWPSPRFRDNKNGTVTDRLTGLAWLRLTDCFGAKTWTQALADANSLMTGQCGLSDGSMATDWRLPNAKELLSLVDYGETNPAMPKGHPFLGLLPSNYWSSSSLVSHPFLAWFVGMEFGYIFDTGKSNTLLVWPVRGPLKTASCSEGHG